MAKTAAKGTIDNPYSMSECEKMLDAGNVARRLCA